MTILTNRKFTALIDELWLEVEASNLRLQAHYAKMPRESFSHIISGVGYREFFADLSNEWLALPREVEELLYMLARSSRAKHIVEFGTSFGMSALFLCAALRDNGGGLLITTEFEPAKIARARQNMAEAGFTDLVEFREGNALDTLKETLPEHIDLVLLDGAKHQYADVLDLLEPRLRPGAFIVADNADWNPAYLQRVRSRKAGYLSIPIGHDVEVAMRLV